MINLEHGTIIQTVIRIIVPCLETQIFDKLRNSKQNISYVTFINYIKYTDV